MIGVLARRPIYSPKIRYQTFKPVKIDIHFQNMNSNIQKVGIDLTQVRQSRLFRSCFYMVVVSKS
jgi:hypothetical protein